MTLPVASFAALPAGIQPLSLFDQQFAAVAQSGQIACTASGNNVIALTPVAGQFTPVTNTTGAPTFVWTQTATNTGPVTINVAGIGPVAAYKNYGQAPIASGDLVGGAQYACAFSGSLAGGAGGYVVNLVQSPGIPEAPADGFTYGRQTGAWVAVMPLAGGTMTGSLNLAHDPTIPQEAATKAYVDAHAGGGGGGGITEAPTDGFTYGRLNATWSKAVPLGGGTMTGPLTLASGATAVTPPPGDNSGLVANTAFVQTTAGGYLPLAGGTMTGLVGLFAGSTAATPATGDNSTAIATTAYVKAQPGITVFRSYLAGLTLSTAGASTSFTVAAGTAADSTNAQMLTLAAALSKTTAAWLVGSGNGALDSGAIANNTWYHVHLIKRTDTNVVDVLVSLTPSAPTLPSPYTLFRRIGSMKTNASGQWTLFHQVGDSFLWDVNVVDVSGTGFATTATLVLLTVPSGVQVEAVFNAAAYYATTGAWLLFTSPDQSDQVPSQAVSSLFSTSTATTTISSQRVRTNTSSQIRARVSATGPTYYINTFGWYDRRGQDA